LQPRARFPRSLSAELLWYPLPGGAPCVDTRRRGAGPLAVALALVLAACAPASEDTAPGVTAAPDVPFELVLEGATPLISDAQTDLALPAAIDVDGDGNVWIADRTLHQVLIVSPQGELLRTIGRAGGGPGEFRGPRGLAIRGAHAYVLDNAHGVQRFDMAGEYVDEYDPASRVIFDFDFTGDGGMVFSNNRVWAVGGLIQVLVPDGAERAVLGEPLYPAEGFNFGEVRQAILDGTIPDVARNGTLPVATPDGSLWAVVHTERQLRRYRPDGTLALQTTFELPELPAIEQQFFEDFADAPNSDVFFFPSFVAAGVATANHLLLLWETVPGSPGLITVHDAAGELVQRWLLPEIDMGGGGMTVLTMALDAQRRRLYVGVSDIATIFAIDLPGAAVAPPTQ
jgi:hypothetical protein